MDDIDSGGMVVVVVVVVVSAVVVVRGGSVSGSPSWMVCRLFLRPKGHMAMAG